MISRIFFDLDETLLHSSACPYAPEQSHVSFTLDDDWTIYYTIFRPCSVRLLEYARELVGAENVYALTSSTRDYARRVNELGGFGWSSDMILSREDIRAHTWGGAYGATNHVPHAQLADKNNVLIDNLPPRENESKLSLIGVNDISRYIQVREYYGVNFPNDTFEEDVKSKLNQLHHGT